MSLSNAERYALFDAGRLRWLLHSSQQEAYDAFRAFEARALEARTKGEFLPGRYTRVFVFDCGRRWGKDFLTGVIATENAIRRPKALLVYATALLKDVTEIVQPLFDQIFENCHPDRRPKHKLSWMGTSNQYVFPNGSVIRLVGLDRNPAGLRGRHSDGMFISEAGFVEDLENTVTTVIGPQMMGRRHANILLNSTPPDVPGHDYDKEFVADAEENGRLIRRTIDDNPLLSPHDKELEIRQMGGPTAERTLRELYCKRIRNSDTSVVPEFSKTRHVRASEMPAYARGITVIDPGVSDLCAIAVGWYDFERGKLVIRRDWAKSNAPTDVVAEALRGLEAETFGELKYWDATKWCDNPFQRFSDTDLRLITDLSRIHNIRIGAAEKTGAEAALHALRNAFLQDQIEIHPDAKNTIAHVENATWNKARTSYERSKTWGHFDCLDVAKYMWRHVDRKSNPNPPRGVLLAKEVNSDDLCFRLEHMRTESGHNNVIRNLRSQPKRLKIRSPRVRWPAR